MQIIICFLFLTGEVAMRAGVLPGCPLACWQDTPSTCDWGCALPGHRKHHTDRQGRHSTSVLRKPQAQHDPEENCKKATPHLFSLPIPFQGILEVWV